MRPPLAPPPRPDMTGYFDLEGLGGIRRDNFPFSLWTPWESSEHVGLCFPSLKRCVTLPTSLPIGFHKGKMHLVIMPQSPTRLTKSLLDIPFEVGDRRPGDQSLNTQMMLPTNNSGNFPRIMLCPCWETILLLHKIALFPPQWKFPFAVHLCYRLALLVRCACCGASSCPICKFSAPC